MKILFVHNYLATFTRIDLDILRSAHEVREMYVRRTSSVELLNTNANLIRNVQWADLVFSWFGGYHALLPFSLARASGRKCVIVASGYDVANVPEISYGNMRPGLRRVIGRQVFGLANCVLAVSEFTRSEAIRNAGVPANKIEVVPHGINAGQFQPRSGGKRVAQVLTVGGVTEATMRTKGLPEYVALAALFPEIPFLIVGPQDKLAAVKLRRAATPNVKFSGPLFGNELMAVMQQSSVYAQLSAYESFGMALGEAMLCGCVPVVTQRGALPEVIGSVGYTAPYGDLDAYCVAVQQALAASPEEALRARQRIVDAFPLQRRKEKLLSILEVVKAYAPTHG